MSYPLENALFQWEEGLRALRAIDDPAERRRADRVVAAIQDELRRRIGPTFTAAELAELLRQGNRLVRAGRARDASHRLQSDPQSLADAAFWIYLRGATDFAGGRELVG